MKENVEPAALGALEVVLREDRFKLDSEDRDYPYFPYSQRAYNVLTHIVAREVGTSVEMAREFGYTMPAAFDVGFELHNLSSQTSVRVRLDDCAVERRLATPGFAPMPGYTPLKLLDEETQRFMENLIRICGEVVHVYIDKHPETHHQSRDAALGAVRANVTDGPGFEAFKAKIEERAKRLTYTPLWR